MSIDILSIGIGFETSGLLTGTAALDKAGAAADRMAERVGKLTPQAANAGAGMRGMGQATAVSAASVEAATKKADEYIKSLQKQLDLYGKSEREIRRYSAATMGMTDAQRKQTDSLLRQNEALERGDAIGKTLKTGMLALGAATVAAGAAALVMAKNMIDSADAMNDMSQRTGIAVKDLAVYEMAAEQSGTTMQAIAMGVKGLSGVMTKHSEDLKAAGITATDADGAMRQLADLFSKMPDGIEKTNLAVKIFGRSGMELIPMLNLGSAGLKEAAEKSAKYAEQMAIMAPLADKYNDHMTEISLSSKAVGMSMLNDALPGILAITRAMADATQKGGVFSGIMAGLSAGMDNYWKGVRGFYGKSEANTGGASGSWAEDGRKGMDDPRIVKPAQGIDAKTSGLIKALNGGSGGGGSGGASKVSDYDRAVKAADSYIAKLKEEATETGATAEQVKMLQAAREATKAPTAALKLMIMTQALANEQLRDTVAAANKEALAAIEIEKELAKSKLDTINANADQVEKIQESTQSVQDQIRAERDHIAEMGLSKDALNALEIARINDHAASLDRMASVREEASPAIAQAYREQADALRGLAIAKGEANAKAGALSAVSDYDKMANSFEGMANSASKMGAGFSGATKALGGFSNAFKTLAAAEKNTAAGSKERTMEQIDGYGQMAGAAKQMFDENSAGYEVLGAIEKGFFIAKMAMQAAEIIGNAQVGASGAAASALQGAADLILLPIKIALGIVNQANGDPYSAFARIAAMAAILGAVAAGVGASSGGGGGGSGGGASGNGKYSGSGQTLLRSGQVDENINMGYVTEANHEDQFAQQQAAINAAKATNALNEEMRKLQYGATKLEQDLADVKTATQGAGRAQYELATNGMNGSEIAAYNYNAALEGQIQVLLDVANGTQNASDNMKKLANDAVNLTIDLKRAQGDIAGANNDQMLLDTVGYTEQEVAVYNYNQSLRDQIASYSSGSSAADDAASAERELAQTRYDLAGRLNVLLGRQTQIQFDRATELAGATDATVIAMLNEIYAIEDLTAARDESFAILERSIAAERKFAEVRLKGATDLATALKTTKDAISPSLDRASAQSQIAMYVALAKAGGVLPTAAALKPALDSIAKPSMDLFTTFSDYAIDQARTANDISDLAGYADKQVSVEQQAIDRMDLQLETAKNQLDAMNGVNTSVMGVTAAVAAFEASMLAISSARSGAAAYSFAAPAGSSGGGGGGGGGYGEGAAGDPAYAAAIAGMDSDIVAAYKAYYGRAPDREGHDSFIQSGLVGDQLMQAILRASAASRGADYDYAMSKGYNPDDPTANYLRSKKKAAAASAPEHYGYDMGSNYIERDQIAQIHQGEEITPRAYVDMQRASRDETNALMRRLVESNERLERKVETLQAAADKTADNTGKAADTLQGKQGVPFLVEIAK